MVGVLLLAAGTCGLVAFMVAPTIDLQTLRTSLDQLAPIGVALGRWPTDRAVLAPFGIGLFVGWRAAVLAHGRSRWRSVLLVDNRQPDMTLAALLLHIQRHASRPQSEALGLIAGAARAGALSIWSSSSAGTVRRLPQRLVRPALARQLQHDLAESRDRVPVDELFFVQTEVRMLWPPPPHIVASQRTALHRGNNS